MAGRSTSTAAVRILRLQVYLSRVGSRLLDTAFPPRCGGCDLRGTLLCDYCREQCFSPTTKRYPPINGLDGLLYAGTFEGPLRTAVHKLKYEGDSPLARPLGELLWLRLKTAKRLVGNGDAPTLVPVPLHSDRERERGFNQSTLIAREVSRLGGWQVGGGLVRPKKTRSQVGLHVDERMENVRGAFTFKAAEVPSRVVLVDDVCTTGATLVECARVLRQGGVEHVYAAVVGRAAGLHPEAGS